MADTNTIIKDGVGNQFFLRAKDIQSGGQLRRTMVYATHYPVDFDGGGIFKARARATSIGAGLAANAPIIQFRYVSSANIALIRRVRLAAWSLGTGFAAGIANFDMYVARNFTIEDTGGALCAISGNSGKLRTTMQPSSATLRYADTAALTAGTRTLDTSVLDGISIAVPTTTNTQITVRTELFESLQGEHPLVLVNNEGFIVQATVPATGVWAFGTTVEWDEVPYF